MILDDNVKKVIEKIFEEAKPVSIFVYGSRARGDFKKNSDYEVGILFKRKEKWGRRELKELHNIENLNLYPFIYEDFIKYSLDTPFPKAVYLKELLEGAKTIKGREIVENMKSPEIKTSDLLEVGTFQIAYALGAVLSSRQKDWVTTSIEFTKSVLFGARTLVVLRTKKFPLEYEDIAKEALKLELDQQYKDLIKHAIDVRNGTKIDPVQLYTNISFLNQIVLQEIKDQMREGYKVILE